MRRRPVQLRGKWCRAIFAGLQALPLIRFALLLGGCLIASAYEAWCIILLWQTSGSDAQAMAFMWIALSNVALIAVGFIAFAFGRLEKVNVSVGGNTVELDFEDKEPTP